MAMDDQAPRPLPTMRRDLETPMKREIQKKRMGYWSQTAQNSALAVFGSGVISLALEGQKGSSAGWTAIAIVAGVLLLVSAILVYLGLRFAERA